tara:strand:- start:1 stop:144 length:144 start_codon:yes stop_codon:yes gene_type:complete
MLASIAQGRDYKALGFETKRLQRVNDARTVQNKSCFKSIQLELSHVA